MAPSRRTIGSQMYARLLDYVDLQATGQANRRGGRSATEIRVPLRQYECRHQPLARIDVARSTGVGDERGGLSAHRMLVSIVTSSDADRHCHA